MFILILDCLPGLSWFHPLLPAFYFTKKLGDNDEGKTLITKKQN